MQLPHEAKVFIGIALFLITFSLALDLSVNSFIDIIKKPKKIILGVIAQNVLLPIFSFLLIYLADLSFEYAMAIIFIASCPGGSSSNFISYLAGGSVAYSMSLTFFSSIIAIISTPFHMSFWPTLLDSTQLVSNLEINRLNLFISLLILLIIPLILGIITNSYFGIRVILLKSILKKLSIIFMISIFSYAIYLNHGSFGSNFKSIFILVLIHQSIALSIGYIMSTLIKLDHKESRSLTIEVGYQNTSLALGVALAFYSDMSQLILLIGWWTIWHNISAFLLIIAWRGKDYFKEKAYIT